MPQTYRDFTELVLHAAKDRDYRLNIVDRRADVTITAVHGGSIEPLTSELAVAIAGDEYNLYDLRGLRTLGCELLRVPIQRFNEAQLHALMQRSNIALSIQGTEGSDPIVHLGGKNRWLKRILAARLQEAGFQVRPPAGPGAAHDPLRFYNLAAEGGIQIELTSAMRASLVDCALRDFLWEDHQHWNDRFCAFVIAIRGAIEQYKAETRSNLDIALKRFEQTAKFFKLSHDDECACHKH